MPGLFVAEASPKYTVFTSTYVGYDSSDDDMPVFSSRTRLQLPIVLPLPTVPTRTYLLTHRYIPTDLEQSRLKSFLSIHIYLAYPSMVMASRRVSSPQSSFYPIY
jgi:hypothetical protein